ncbi:ring-1,2-phenylacetyl-CoA epoxidase subunit PaaC [Melghirimyces thermohalophilus]|uniref:Ring-1,2-phenylacetyl-CoA epoxidase subunit PaaC n=1 Tax=Melghirimyces thermohalophilus TaxID=1236220 RepID=A0A1G6LEA2_9BACL|nr:1,2-phenylacetyl-CoA epoxidase subunit PaaC [Melghirimyces thermohalophilus]SDC41561.1 ring-1,2-phenylacetyl-CoA epoxidase subunit PaaC [Melghirimyces thermohalophilus]
MTMEQAAQMGLESGYRQALTALLYQLADDELCLGHRDSEWLGLAPDIEGDVAFSSIAQDEVGHAVFYLERLHELGEKDPDSLAFFRGAEAWRNAVLLEQPNGDWARTILRHFLYDLFDDVRTEALLHSSYEPLAQGVAKIRREEHYHLLHLKPWLIRLARAGGDAQERMEQAVMEVWAQLGGLFSLGAEEEEMIHHGLIAWGREELYRRWEDRAKPVFAEAGLKWPGPPSVPEQDGRRGRHTDHLTELIRTMSEVAVGDPAARW